MNKQKTALTVKEVHKTQDGGGGGLFLPAGGDVILMCARPCNTSCLWLAYTLVCVNVALTVRAGMCHVLEIINQAGNQAAAKITPANERADNIQTRHMAHVKKWNNRQQLPRSCSVLMRSM